VLADCPFTRSASAVPLIPSVALGEPPFKAVNVAIFIRRVGIVQPGPKLWEVTMSSIREMLARFQPRAGKVEFRLNWLMCSFCVRATGKAEGQLEVRIASC